jgi:hypothetical protein
VTGIVHVWSLRYPFAGSTGVEFARGLMDPTPVLLAHAAPDALTVEVYENGSKLIAIGQDLIRKSDPTPITKLRIDGERITREDVWPGDDDIGLPVILPGGEVGIITEWSNATDLTSWEWSVRFSNHI